MNLSMPARLSAPLSHLLAFLGRETDWTREVEESISPEEVYIKNLEALPVEGEADIKYHVLADMSLWRWADGAYHEVNPYVYGVDSQYWEKPRTIRPNTQIVDSSAELASLSLDQVRSGSSPSLAVYYNLIALRADLDMLRRLSVVGHNMSLQDLVSRGPSTDKERNATEWFQREHKALYQLLLSSARSKADMFAPVIDVLHHNEASLTWDEKLNRPVFKTNDFKVYL